MPAMNTSALSLYVSVSTVTVCAKTVNASAVRCATNRDKQIGRNLKEKGNGRRRKEGVGDRGQPAGTKSRDLLET